MIFRNRSEAGNKLADYLEKSDTVVVALARGGSESATDAHPETKTAKHFSAV